MQLNAEAMELRRDSSVSCNVTPSFMIYLSQFRRCFLLLLSLTLSAQAMAVASVGACHRMKALTAVHQAAEPTAHHHADAAAHDDGSMHHADATGKSPASDDTRLSCAACAACHLCAVMPNVEIALTDNPIASAAIFLDTDVARARNVASGLDRPPRA